MTGAAVALPDLSLICISTAKRRESCCQFPRRVPAKGDEIIPWNSGGLKLYSSGSPFQAESVAGVKIGMGDASSSGMMLGTYRYRSVTPILTNSQLSSDFGTGDTDVGRWKIVSDSCLAGQMLSKRSCCCPRA